MKYAIVIPDGCADEPQDSLGGRTPLQAARKPNMDQMARMGIVGRSNNVPATLTAASDVATLSLFGYDPLAVYTGRAPLEAAAMGVRLGPDDWAIRCNLITVQDGCMTDFTAGHIKSAEAGALIQTLQENLAASLSHFPDDSARLEFHAGVSYRNLLVYRGAGRGGRFDGTTKTQPPHDVPDQPIATHLPQGLGADLLCSIMEHSCDILGDHPVNRARLVRGERPASQVWLWGQGRAPRLRAFLDVYGKRGAIISAVDLVRGVGVLLDWKRVDVPTATGYLDTDYAGKGRAAIAALPSHDLVCVHVEAPDEASHEGRADAKVAAIEEIDRHIAGPLLDALPAHGDWRILVSPDHRTFLRTRAHAHGAVPFAMAGTGILPAGQPTYDEATASSSALSFDRGCDLMARFLG
jgi:2,3-bisphosphoglycerate-independent phosphoglycerate mutase